MDNKMMKLERMKQFDGTMLSENMYNAAIGLTIIWGLLVNVIMAALLQRYVLGIDVRVVLVLYLVLSFGSMFLVYKSQSPALSFVGFTGLAIGMGLLLTFMISTYTSSSVYNAFIMTGIIVVIMLIVSTLYPSFFLGLGRTLGLALIATLVVELVGGLLLRLPLSILDYFVVIIFAGYIGFDWAKAQQYPHTLNNAVDSAADIYVDIINIFVRILSIIGKKDD